MTQFPINNGAVFTEFAQSSLDGRRNHEDIICVWAHFSLCEVTPILNPIGKMLGRVARAGILTHDFDIGVIIGSSVHFSVIVGKGHDYGPFAGGLVPILKGPLRTVCRNPGGVSPK